MSILQNEEFLEKKYKWRRWCRENDESASHSFNQGGQAAEEILRKQHDEEMIEFAEWVGDRYIFLSNKKWCVCGELLMFNKTFKTTAELLQLFRKEKQK